MKTTVGASVWLVVFGAAFSVTMACSGDKDDPNDNGGEGGDKAATGGEGGETGDGSGGKASATGGEGGAADLCAGVTCSNDSNDCTEDTCNPETGECGIPRTGTACSDGIFCNGPDTCDAGECIVHAGTPCDGACDEGNDQCICGQTSDCPGADISAETGTADDWGTIGDWSTCEYDDTCDEAGSRSRVVTTQECVTGGCVVTNATETDSACEPRDTDGDECPDSVYCDGVEVCSGGNCVEGDAIDCTGGTPHCSESADACVECTSNTQCGDGEVCTSNTCSEGCVTQIADPCDVGLTCMGPDAKAETGLCLPDSAICTLCKRTEKCCQGTCISNSAVCVPTSCTTTCKGGLTCCMSGKVGFCLSSCPK